MFWDSASKNYQDVQQSDNTSSFGHEALAGAASFGAFKVFEDRQRSEGKPVAHQFAKEMLVGLAGAEIDKLVETKGMDEFDKVEANRHAKEQVESMYDEQYGGQDQYDPNNSQPHDALQSGY